MSRGERSGGGQSSLGYLFGSEDDQQPSQPLPTKTVVLPLPPYGIDIDNYKSPHGDATAAATQVIMVSNSNRSQQGHHLGNFVSVSFSSVI